jgi:hypothetical protein
MGECYGWILKQYLTAEPGEGGAGEEVPLPKHCGPVFSSISPGRMKGLLPLNLNCTRRRAGYPLKNIQNLGTVLLGNSFVKNLELDVLAKTCNLGCEGREKGRTMRAIKLVFLEIAQAMQACIKEREGLGIHFWMENIEAASLQPTNLFLSQEKKAYSAWATPCLTP